MYASSYRAILRPLGYLFLVAEVTICFGQLVLMLTFSLFSTSYSLISGDVPCNVGITCFFSLCGLLGVVGLVLILAKISDPTIHNYRNEYLWIFIFLGLLALFFVFEFDLRTSLKPEFIFFGLLPILYTSHVIWLGRKFLFQSVNTAMLKVSLAFPILLLVLLLGKELYQIYKYPHIEVVEYDTLFKKLEYGKITTEELKVAVYNNVKGECRLKNELANSCWVSAYDDAGSLDEADVLRIGRSFNNCVWRPIYGRAL